MSIVYERISVIVSLSLIGLTLYSALPFAQQVTAIMLFNSPLGIDSPQRWVMGLLLVAMAVAGTDTVIRTHPQLPSTRLNYVATFCMLPGLLVILATQVLAFAPNSQIWAGGLVSLGLLMWVTIFSQFQQVALKSNVQQAQWSRIWQQLLGYSLMLILSIVIYHARSRAALSATGMSIITLMTTVTLLRQESAHISKTWLFAGIIALNLGQLMWVLNYWRITSLHAGLILFLMFYILLGLAQQQLLGKFSQRLLWEFGIMAAITLLVIFRL